jgi:hypothetical protein
MVNTVSLSVVVCRSIINKSTIRNEMSWIAFDKEKQEISGMSTKEPHQTGVILFLINLVYVPLAFTKSLGEANMT